MITGGLTILLVVFAEVLMFCIGYFCGADNRDKKWNKDIKVMTDKLDEEIREYQYKVKELNEPRVKAGLKSSREAY